MFFPVTKGGATAVLVLSELEKQLCNTKWPRFANVDIVIYVWFVGTRK